MQHPPASLAALLLPLSAAAQEVIQTQSGLAPNDGFGTSFVVAELGGPAGEELLIGAPEGTSGPGPGYVQVVAADGLILHTRLDGPAGSVAFGWDVARAPDLDGDARPDVLAGDPYFGADVGRIAVLSSADGAVLFTLAGAVPGARLGRQVAELGDVDGDGLVDFAAGAPGSVSLAPAVLVRSGAGGAALYTLSGDTLGATGLSGIGDVTGDGRADFATGDPLWAGGDGALRVWSGDGSSVRVHLGEHAGAGMGSSVCGLGDVDLDGVPDYAVGAYDFASPALGTVGAVYAMSGATGAELWRADGDLASDNFGYRIAGGYDLDADGVPDAATASLKNGHALSGVDGARLFTVTGGYFGTSVAMDVALVPDRNGDALAELALSGLTGIALPGGGSSSDVSIVETFAPLPLDCDGSGGYDFIELAQGTSPDCNSNGIPDACDLASGVSLDVNLDGVPDECQVTFFGAPGAISVSAGGEFGMTIAAGPAAAFKTYFIAGSLSGSTPGTSLAGHFVPLNPDPWFTYTVNHANQWPLVSTAAQLGLFGSTDAPALWIPLGLDPAWVGVTLHHAYALIDGATVLSVSNAVALTLTP